jgi:flagellar hook-associated protein 3 FlgL
MRVSSNTVSDGIVRQIQQLSSQQAKLQNQVGTGLRISQPEDDPAAVGRVLNIISERRQLVQFGSNASRALELSRAASSGLQAAKKISDRAGELATLGTGAIGASAMAGYGAEGAQLVEQALQLANTRFNGDYIYAGSKLDTPPFVATRDANGQITSVAYQGDATQTTIPISESSSVSPTTDGTTNQGIADFINHLVSLRDALNGGSTPAVAAVQPNLATSEDLLVSTIADNGGEQTRIEASQSQQTDRTTSLDSLISSETDADLPSTLVKLNQTQTAYQAALQSASNIMKLSLLDYLK